MARASPTKDDTPGSGTAATGSTAAKPPWPVAEAMPPGHSITRLNDQHAFLRCPAGSPLAVGDLVGLGISHPCTTFDKWSLISVVNDTYDVVGAIRTFF